jgi:polysaccharide export outer membrane protein
MRAPALKGLKMIKKKWNWLALVSCLTLVSMSSGQVANRVAPLPTEVSPKSVEPPSYLIQPNDILQIFVWRDPAVSRDRVLVRPDGRISLPLVQDLQAAGLSPIQLKESLEQRLAEFINVPNVTVIVDSIQSYRIYVMGNVGGPGVQVSATPLTIMQALATAGGFNEFADKGNIVVFRGDSRIRFDYADFVKGRNAGQNILLLSGDVVNVP